MCHFSIFVDALVMMPGLCFHKLPEKIQRLLNQLQYLALGDSYTIGESVDEDLSFPSQTVALLRRAGFNFADPTIIAKTGWTTDELTNAIADANLPEKFDIVSLLIGVNNQYRSYPIENYEKEFESLLKTALSFAGNQHARVFVLSIPDWGVTPYAAGRDKNKIATEIDAYNSINNSVAKTYKVNYIDITPETRNASSNIFLLAPDGLHPSALAYTEWAIKLSETIKVVLLN